MLRRKSSVLAVATEWVYRIPLPDPVRALLLSVLSIWSGLLAHQYVERPIMDFCRRLRKNWGPAPVSA